MTVPAAITERGRDIGVLVWVGGAGVGRSDATISIFADMALSSTELPILTLFYLTLSHF